MLCIISWKSDELVVLGGSCGVLERGFRGGLVRRWVGNIILKSLGRLFNPKAIHFGEHPHVAQMPIDTVQRLADQLVARRCVCPDYRDLKKQPLRLQRQEDSEFCRLQSLKCRLDVLKVDVLDSVQCLIRCSQRRGLIVSSELQNLAKQVWPEAVSGIPNKI